MLPYHSGVAHGFRSMGGEASRRSTLLFIAAALVRTPDLRADPGAAPSGAPSAGELTYRLRSAYGSAKTFRVKFSWHAPLGRRRGELVVDRARGKMFVRGMGAALVEGELVQLF